MRARDGQRSGGAGAGQADGDGLGELRAYGESQPTGSAVDAVHTRWVPDDGLRRGVPQRQRSGSRGPEDSSELSTSVLCPDYASVRINAWTVARCDRPDRTSAPVLSTRT